MDGGNENEFVSPATIPPNTDIENEDIGLPPTGIGVRPDSEENQTDNPTSDLIGGIGFPPPGIGGPGAELPEFPGFPGRPPIRPPTKPPFDPDTNTEKPDDGFDGIGPLITTTTDYPEDSPTTFSPIDEEADVVVIDQFAGQNITVLETRAFDMVSYLSTLETRIVFNRLNTGACQLHCTVITKTNKLFVDQEGNKIDVEYLPTIYLVEGRTDCRGLIEQGGDIFVKFIGAIRFAGIVIADITDTLQFDELYGRCVAILVKKQFTTVDGTIEFENELIAATITTDIPPTNEDTDAPLATRPPSIVDFEPETGEILPALTTIEPFTMAIIDGFPNDLDEGESIKPSGGRPPSSTPTTQQLSSTSSFPVITSTKKTTTTPSTTTTRRTTTRRTSTTTTSRKTTAFTTSKTTKSSTISTSVSTTSTASTTATTPTATTTPTTTTTI